MWMLTPEEDPTLGSLQLLLRHVAGGIILAFGVLLVVSLSEHRLPGADRYLDFFAMALIAGVAGACAGAGRRFLSVLRLLRGQAKPLDSAARSTLRQYRFAFGLGVALFFFFAVILFLLAVSIGTGHGEWVSWMPDLPRRRGLVDLLFR